MDGMDYDPMMMDGGDPEQPQVKISAVWACAQDILEFWD